METIRTYLENMFRGLPESDELNLAKANLLEIMEDKYEEQKRAGRSENEAVGTVIAEFGNIDELLNELGINKEQTADESEIEKRYLSDTEAQNIITEKKSQGVKLATGISICILAPAIMCLMQGILIAIFGNTLSEDIIDNYCTIGLIVMIVIGVAIIVYTGIKMDKYDFLEKEDIQISAYYKEKLEKEREDYHSKFAFKICIGVVACVLSVIAPIVAETTGETAVGEGISVFIMLTMVAFGVWHFVTAGVTSETYKQLLSKEEYSKKSKTNNKVMDKIGSIYWPLVSIGYLVWSFLTMRWYFTWIVWPIAGLLYGAISIVVNGIMELQKK